MLLSTVLLYNKMLLFEKVIENFSQKKNFNSILAHITEATFSWSTHIPHTNFESNMKPPLLLYVKEKVELHVNY